MRNKRVRCPKCESFCTKITCQQVNDDGSLIRRYRKCLDCAHKFRTTQAAEVHDDDGEMWGTTRVEPGAHPSRLYTRAQIDDIVEKYKSGRWLQSELALQLGSDESYISKLIRKSRGK